VQKEYVCVVDRAREKSDVVGRLADGGSSKGEGRGRVQGPRKSRRQLLRRLNRGGRSSKSQGQGALPGTSGAWLCDDMEQLGDGGCQCLLMRAAESVSCCVYEGQRAASGD
jgi:hypothetical protein